MASYPKSEKTKQKIFETALSLFREKGFEQVSIQEITKKAGTSKGSFYSYYSTKSDIIVQEFWAIDAYYRSIEDVVRKENTAEARLLAFTKLQLTYVRDIIGQPMLKVLYANQVTQEGADKVITDQSRFWHTFIMTLIAEGQQSGEFKTEVDAPVYAQFFNRAIRGLFLDWNIRSASFDLVEEGLAYTKYFLLSSLLKS
ncbi:MAG: TetR/AcrR family transcriptional regulator [Spirochaetia bacterium]|nr:TetR/AcrR family transcriptional regulator [Spirochaetia bacterium]